MKSSWKSTAAAVACLLLTAGTVQAQTDYPNKPIEVIVGYAAAGPVDILARTIAPFLEKYLGNDASIAVINRPGASGVLASADVAKAAPDGYTLTMFSHPALFTTLYGQPVQPYTVESFDYIGTITSEPHNLFVAAGSEFKTLADVIAAAKANPGGVTIGAAGIGAAGHLALKLFEQAAGLQFNYIPAAGAAESVTQVLGGHIQGGFTTISGTLPMVKEGQVRILGTLTDARVAALSDVPTFKEQGVDIEWGAVRGLAGPAGLPPEVLQKLTDALAKAVADPEFVAIAEKQGLSLEYLNGEQFEALAARQIDFLNKVWETSPWQ